VQAEKVYKWRFQSLFQPTHIIQIDTLPRFIERVKKATNGQLIIELYSGGELVPTRALADAVSHGMIEMALTAGVYCAGKIPVGNIQGGLEMLPHVYDSIDDIKKLHYNLGWDEIMRQGYAKYNIYYPGGILYGPSTFWSKKEMKSLAGLKGFKVRSYGYIAKTFTKIGAAPVFMPQSEVYTALATGTIDGAGTAAEIYDSGKFYEVCPFFYMPAVSPGGIDEIFINMKAWEKLPDRIKKIVQAEIRETSEYHWKKIKEIQKNMYAKFNGWGTQKITFSREDVIKWREVSLSFLPELSAKGKEVAEAAKILENYLESKK
jgi:TRAP-type C4-dicarboxylate transport system substrate-binding protein